MSEISITLTPMTVQLIDWMQDMPDELLKAIARGMDKGLQLVSGQIQRTRLTGKGPFPADQGRLGVVTNRLRGSLHSTASVIDGQRITGGIGTNVAYMGIHEFGGTINRTTKAGSVRLRTTSRGELMTGKTGGAIFAKRKGKDAHKRFKVVSYEGGKSYTITMPERAPIRTGFEENKQLLTDAILDSCGALWEARGTK